MSKSINASEAKTIILACEAGMGSSLMSVNSLKKKLKKAGVKDVKVIHSAARALSDDAKLIIVHKGLAKMVASKVPNAVVVSFSQFLNDPVFDEIVQAFVNSSDIVSTEG